MELFNNKNNNYLKFKINSEGIDIDRMEARLILTTNENKNYFFVGSLDDNICKFNIPELKIYEKGDIGRMKFEIISDDLYFPVWEDSFEIKTKSTVKIEEMISETKEDIKQPIINASVIIEKNDNKEGVDDYGNDIKETEDVIKSKNSIKDDNHDDKEIKEKVEEIKNFSSFLGE